MSIEFAIILAIATFTGIAILGHIVAFGAVFAHADRLSGGRSDTAEICAN